jgi:hypothetical protein
MSYMSQFLMNIIVVLCFVFAPFVWADTSTANGGRMSDEAACRQVEYYKKLNELNANYKACTDRYAEYVAKAEAAGQQPYGSIGACGNPGSFQAQADSFSKDLCAKICYGTGGVTGDVSSLRRALSVDPDMVTNDDEQVTNDEAGGVTCGLPGLPACKTTTDLGKRDDTGKVTDTGKGKDTGKGTDTGKGKDTGKTTDTGKGKDTGKTTDTGKGKGTDTATSESVVPQDPGPAQYEAQGDIQTANNALSNGNRCCSSPQSCTNLLSPGDQQNFRNLWNQANTQAPTSGAGLSEYCSQMKSLTGTGGGLNNYMSTICYSGKNECEMTCDSLLSKYEALYNNCGGCSSAGIYSSTYNSIKSIRNSCTGLASRANALAQQGSANSYSGGYAQACNNFTGKPSSLDGLTPQEQAEKDAAANNNCLLNPNASGCKQPELAVKEQTERSGDAGFGAEKKDEKPVFNLPDTQDMQAALNAGLGKGVQPQAVTNGTIANNSGGAIPGGGNVQPASLGGGGRGGSPGSPGYDTDILRGTVSASGGSSGLPNNILPNDIPQNGRWRTMSAGGEISPLVGMDLKQYLPGGSLDPNRKIAGISPGSQINRKEEDIWRIISNKMYEKCKLGVLWQCGPE